MILTYDYLKLYFLIMICSYKKHFTCICNLDSVYNKSTIGLLILVANDNVVYDNFLINIDFSFSLLFNQLANSFLNSLLFVDYSVLVDISQIFVRMFLSNSWRDGRKRRALKA